MDKEPDTRNISEPQISDLLQKIGSREMPSAAMTEEVKANVRLVWLETVARQKRRARQKYAIAAGFVLALGCGFLLVPGTEPESYASATRLINQVDFLSEQGEWLPLAETQISGNLAIRTGMDGYASIVMANGLNVRIANNSQIELQGIDQIEALSGVLYIDSDSQATSENSILVISPFGRVRDIGTQFQVKVSPTDWAVQVREGQVEINSGEQHFVVNEDERVSIGQDDSILKSNVSGHDESWKWAQQLSSPFTLEGARLSDFLSWVARESGLDIEYQSEFVRNSAQFTTLHGSINGLLPQELLSIVLASTDFTLLDTNSAGIVVGR